MNNILPAIIAKDFNELSSKVSLVDGLVDWAQIDIMDGVFVPPVTWNNPKDLYELNTSLNFEAHLMVSDPETYIHNWINSPVKRVLLHYESANTSTLLRLVNLLKESDIEAGISLKLETSINDAEEVISEVGAIQLMSIAKIGYYGQIFDARVIPKILSLREKFPNVKIGVDGGVNLESAEKLLSVGVDRLVVGSAIFKSENIKEIITKLQNL